MQPDMYAVSTDDDELVPMPPTLAKHDTHTEYNEFELHEWQRPMQLDVYAASTDDDELVPMPPPLAKHDTHTEYNEFELHEWQRPMQLDVYAASTDDDDELVPMPPPLAKHDTHTEYNEFDQYEWQRPMQLDVYAALTDADEQRPMQKPECNENTTRPREYNKPVGEGYCELNQKLIAKLKEDLEAGGSARDKAVATLQGHIVVLSNDYDTAGCRLVQLAFEVCDPEVASELASELQGHVPESACSKFGNYVIQKVVELFPTLTSSIVAKEILGFTSTISRVAKNKFGCRILQRLVERAGKQEVNALVTEMSRKVHDFAKDAYAHHVLETILKVGTPKHKTQIARALSKQVWKVVENRNAVSVIESVFQHCSEEDKHMMTSSLFAGTPEDTAKWVGSNNGVGACAVRSLMKVPGNHIRIAMEAINKAASLLQQTQKGRKLLKELKVVVPEVNVAISA